MHDHLTPTPSPSTPADLENVPAPEKFRGQLTDQTTTRIKLDLLGFARLVIERVTKWR
jgi:hypothetical protein